MRIAMLLASTLLFQTNDNGSPLPKQGNNLPIGCVGPGCSVVTIVSGSLSYDTIPTWNDWMEKGAYHAEFVAPLNDWHCDVAGTVPGPTRYGGPGEVQAVTIVCAKNRKVQEKR